MNGIPKVTISVSEDTTNYYSNTVPFVPVVLMKTTSGNIGTAELVRSESEFISKFGKGTIDTPSAYAMQIYLRSYSYAYVTRLANTSAAKATASMSVSSVQLVSFETVYKTANLNGAQISLVNDSTNTKLYLSATINSSVVTSIKETIDLTEATAIQLEDALDKICDSFNEMNLGIKATNLYVNKIAGDTVPTITTVTSTLAEGDSGLSGTIANDTIIAAANLYANAGSNIDVMIVPEFNSSTLVTSLVNLAEEYNFMFISSLNSTSKTDAVTEVADFPASDSLAVYFPNVTYSGFNATIPASIAVLSAYARNDNINKWLAPAGVNRATLSLVSGLSVKLSDEDMSDLYDNTNPINCIKYITNNGYTIWGQKTTDSSATFLDRINISRLVKYVYQEVHAISSSYLFEPITSSTFQGWNLKVTQLLDKLVTGDAITDYSCKMDSENNTAETIAQNKLIGSVRIKPVEVAEFIEINFVLTSEI